MACPKDTAEEQLLKLIEGSASGSPVPAVQKTQVRWQNLFARWKKSAKRKAGDRFLSNLKLGIWALWGVLGLLGAYLVFDIMQPAPQSRVGGVLAGLIPGRAIPDASQPAAKPDEYLKPLSVYISSANSRSPFGSAGGGLAEPEPARVPAVNRIEMLAQGLVVVGIDKSGGPQAIIEDTNLKRTFFVRAGDEVNQLKVLRIHDRGVVLGYENKEIELAY